MSGGQCQRVALGRAIVREPKVLKDDKVIVKFDSIPDEWEVPYDFFTKADKRFLDGKKKLTLGLRPEHIAIGKDSNYPFTTKCVVSYVEELGTECLVYGDLNIKNADSITATPTRITIKVQ